jgi:predicted aspartyl protease
LLLPAVAPGGAQEMANAEAKDPSHEADLLPYGIESGRMSVPVTINGSGPFSFLVDTGSERTVISRELAGALQLGAGPKTRMHSVAGSGNVATVIIPRLELSRRTVKGIAAPALPQHHIGAAGMLGIDSLKSQHILFDFAARQMLITPEPTPVRRTRSDEIIVTARSRLGRLVLTDAAVHGSRAIVILDTGAEVSIGNEALRRKLMKMGKLRETTPLQLISVTGQHIPADYTSIERVTIGGLLLTDMPVAFGKVRLFDELDLKDRPAVLLGMDVLSRFDQVGVNFPKREVRFQLPTKVQPETLALR